MGSSGTTASNNKLKSESLSIKEEPLGETNNPDFHNIYDEITNKLNNNILTSESNAKNSNNQNTNNKHFSIKNQILINNNNNNNIKENVDLNTEYDNHNTNNYNLYCVTEANINQTETNQENKILGTEINNDFQTKENNYETNIYKNNENDYSNNNNNNERLVIDLETLNFHDQKINSDLIHKNDNNHKEKHATDHHHKATGNSGVDNKNNYNINNYNKNNNLNNPIGTEGGAENLAIPDYLPTEVNNVVTSNNTLFQETENNTNHNNINQYSVKTKDNQDKESMLHYSNYVCATEADADAAVLRTSVHKNENHYLNTTSNNNENEIKQHSVTKSDYSNTSNDLKIQNSNIKEARNISEIDYTNNKFTNSNSKNENNNNNPASKRTTNLKTYQNNNKNNNVNNYNNKNTFHSNSNSKRPDPKKAVILYDKKNYNSKNTTKNNANNIYKNSLTEASYIENNTLNTESSIKREAKTNRANFGGTNAVMNQYDTYLRTLIKTKAERFKKGFFNTSVSYEKSGDVRNRTFDNRMSENSKSKSNEKSAVCNLNSSINKKTNVLSSNNKKNVLALGKTMINNTKIAIGGKINLVKFQTNGPYSSKNSSNSRSKIKSNNNADDDKENENSTYKIHKVNFSSRDDTKEQNDKKTDLNRSNNFGKNREKTAGNDYVSMLSKFKYANKFL